MEKKQLISVVKPLIAAALLFGSSGGVAWGQIYKNQRNPDKAQASADKKERAQLRAFGDRDGGLNGPGSGGACQVANYSYDVWGSFTPDNHFGPGESGTITATGSGNSSNTGTWTNAIPGTPSTFTPSSTFNVGTGGIITVGGTNNHIGHKVNGGAWDGTGYSLSKGPTCASSWLAHQTFGVMYQNGCSSGTYTATNTNARVGSTYLTLSGGGYGASNCRGTSFYRVRKPRVPNNIAWIQQGSVGSYADETKIIVDGTAKSESTPWNLQIFNFLENKWYYYETTIGTNTCNVVAPTITYDYPGYDSGCTWTTLTGTTKGTDQTHTYVTFSTTSNNLGNTVNARIQLLAGSNVRLTGHSNKSIGHGTLGGTTAYLNLPASYYTLMNDEPVVFGSIVYNSNGGNSVDPILGTDAVFGINKTLDKDLKTNTAGGTILIGAITRTDATSQSKITIQAATVNAGAPLGFAASGDVVYTGTCIPAAGTANLGNYQTTNAEDITVDNNLNPVHARCGCAADLQHEA